ncbi:MAG: sugar phosphate nucleotidyltransferase [Planctomycetota bacterium]
MPEYCGVILSAGKGSRIDPFHTHYPKPLLPIGNVPIIGHQIEILKSLGIRKVYIVVGHLMDKILNAFGRGSEYGVEIEYVEQEKILGIAHAVGRLAPHIDVPFFLFLGDIFYVPERIERMKERFERGDVAGVLAVKQEPDPDAIRKNFTVSLEDDDRVTRVVEKPRRIENDLKGCGIYLFSPEVFDAIRKTPRTAMRDEYEITDSVQILIDSGAGVAACKVVAWDYNITFPQDVLTCNLRWLDHLGEAKMVDPTADLAEGTEIVHSVIGAGVRVKRPIRIEHTVILPGTVVDQPTNLDHAVMSHQTVIHCR